MKLIPHKCMDMVQMGFAINNPIIGIDYDKSIELWWNTEDFSIVDEVTVNMGIIVMYIMCSMHNVEYQLIITSSYNSIVLFYGW